LIVPNDKTAIELKHLGCPAKAKTPEADSSKSNAKQGRQLKNYSWAQLMARVFELDVLSCPHCGGRVRVLYAINSPAAIQKILACLKLPTRAPPIASAKPEVGDEFF
jgi:acyl-CoA synthetase (AMP-forming)/AMP-acid ligase II